MAVSVTLANGDTVLVYQTPTGVSFDELDSTLTPIQLGTVVPVGAATSWINAQALSDGGFTVEWNAQGVRMAQDFDATGTATDQPHAASTAAPLALLAFSSNANGVTTVLPLPTGGSVTGAVLPSGGVIQQSTALGAPVAPAVDVGFTMGLEPLKFAPLADGSYVAAILDNFHAGNLFVDHLSAAGAFISQTTVFEAGVEGALIGGYSISGLADGGYVLAWTAPETPNGSLSSTIGVYLQAYAASGDAVGSPQIIGVDAKLDDTPLIEALPDGRYVVAWTGTSGPQDEVFTETDPALGVQNARAPIPPPRNGFSGDYRSNFVIENTGGAVVMGEVGPSGQAIYSQVGGLGPEWKFVGDGDFPTVGFLLENTNGAVVLGGVQNAQAHYAQVGALGPEWSFVGTGDFLGTGQDQFLIENTNGAVVTGDLRSGLASYTQVGALGPEWSFVGSGDFLGATSQDQFLIENTIGAVVVGEVGANGQASYTQVASLGPEWKFVGDGDFLGDGKTDFLIENTNTGAVVAGEVGTGGKATFTQVGGLGPEWKFVGAGDYLGEGHDQFLIQNTAGIVVVGDVRSGQAAYSQIGGLGVEWSFRA